jgi:hypothetical protein
MELSVKNSYPVDNKTNVPYTKRDSSPFTEIRGPTKNGGLYGGEHSNKPWMPIYVEPTSTGFMENLRSANPPPGAISQFVGTTRLGNNYTAMPGVEWYVSKKPECGPHSIKGIKE